MITPEELLNNGFTNTLTWQTDDIYWISIIEDETILAVEFEEENEFQPESVRVALYTDDCYINLPQIKTIEQLMEFHRAMLSAV